MVARGKARKERSCRRLVQCLVVTQLDGFSRRIWRRLNLCNFAKDVFCRYPPIKPAMIVANEKLIRLAFDNEMKHEMEVTTTFYTCQDNISNGQIL